MSYGPKHCEFSLSRWKVGVKRELRIEPVDRRLASLRGLGRRGRGRGANSSAVFGRRAGDVECAGGEMGGGGGVGGRFRLRSSSSCSISFIRISKLAIARLDGVGLAGAVVELRREGAG